MPLEDLVSMTSKERILLYLSDFRNMEERYELPSDLVQQSIAFATGVQRKHLSQYLDDLMEEDLIVERKAHIQGLKQRMNGYYLTPAGFSRASGLRERIAAVMVPVKMNGGTKYMRVADIDDATSVHITFCDIVREAIQGKGLDMDMLENIEARRRAALAAKERAREG